MSVSNSVLRPGQLWSRKDYDSTEFRFLILEELLPDGEIRIDYNTVEAVEAVEQWYSYSTSHSASLRRVA